MGHLLSRLTSLCFPDADNEIPLKRIFHGIEQEGSGHYFSNINVQS